MGHVEVEAEVTGFGEIEIALIATVAVEEVFQREMEGTIFIGGAPDAILLRK